MMKKTITTMLIFLSLISCLPEGWDVPTKFNLDDLWVLETGEIRETLDLDSGRFTWTRTIDGADIVTPVTGKYNVKKSADYGQYWYVLELIPDGENQPVYSFKMTLTENKQLLTLEGSSLSSYYRVEREKE